MTESAIVTSGLRKRFGGTEALAGVDMAVPRGAVYVLVGPNGAGKTTLLRVLLDLVRADDGTATVLGLDSVADGARVRASIGYVPERQDAGYSALRVGALLRHHASYYPAWDRAYADELLGMFDLRAERKFGKLSKGQARRVQLVLALAHRPPVLLLDEPTDGLDPVMREQTMSVLSEHMARYETTVLVSTHLVHEVEGLGDHLGVLHDGRLFVQLARETLRRDVRRYVIDVPEPWSGAQALNGGVLRRAGGGREQAWTIWGDEATIVTGLNSAGASVRVVEPLSLQDAAVALLAKPGATPVETSAGPTREEVAR
ncbi:MAG: ABC transporter ATP-binding protein [Longimicrobiales bacterium]